jgi:hypothetical protein
VPSHLPRAEQNLSESSIADEEPGQRFEILFKELCPSAMQSFGMILRVRRGPDGSEVEVGQLSCKRPNLGSQRRVFRKRSLALVLTFGPGTEGTRAPNVVRACE